MKHIDVYKIIVENATEEDYLIHFDSDTSFNNNTFIAINTNDKKCDKKWGYKRTEEFELVNYMNSPLWKALNE